MTALALVVRVVAGALAGVVVGLGAHFGLSLDQDTAVTFLTATVVALGTLLVHLAAGRWPAVGRLVSWLSRAAVAVPSSSSLPAGPTAPADPRPVGGGNVHVMPSASPPAGPSTGTP